MKPATRLVVLAALGALAACSQQKPAEEAITAAENALEAVHEEALKYAPGEYKDVKAELDRAREALKAGKYADAIAAVKDVPAHTATLAGHAGKVKADLATQLKGEWEGLSSTVPGMVSAVEAKLTELAGKTRLPAGMTTATIDEATLALTNAKQAWATAQQKFAAGDFEQAVANAMATQSISRKLMVALGLAKAEEPAAEATPAPAAEAAPAPAAAH